jgi:hypothetical protein
MRRDEAMHYLKVVCGFACFLILASNVWSMSRWSEARGVYDDVCYLRRVHAVLYDSCRNAFAVELAVCLADAAGGNGSR